jgi:hypothetical protein
MYSAFKKENWDKSKSFGQNNTDISKAWREQQSSMADWELHIKNKERGFNYLAPPETKYLSPERISLGMPDITKSYAGQIGVLRMIQDKKLENLARGLRQNAMIGTFEAGLKA